MTRTRLVPYRPDSASVRKLSQATGILRTNLNALRYRYRDGDLLINWGRHDHLVPGPEDAYVNFPDAVSRARNKLIAFACFDAAGVPTLEWTPHPYVAEQWWKDGADVVVRGTATGQAGAGIRLVTQNDAIGDVEHGTLDAWPLAPLYTKYAKKRHEYRLHVWGKDLLDIQQKRKRNGSDADAMIRSWDNGWVFCREGVVCPEAVSHAAVAAVAALGLDFGAVDVGWNEHYQRAYVYEVNTAPGLEGATLEKYANKIKEIANR